MKAEETRANLIKELNAQYHQTGSFFSAPKIPDGPVTHFPSPSFEKPKMFEPIKIGTFNSLNATSDIPAVHGIGFKDNVVVKKKVKHESAPQEIYNMKELINSNPEGMRTLSYDTKTIKEQYALVKRREWQDILFYDVNLFKPIDITSSFRKFFKF